MAIEIERRFLVDPMGDWRHASRRETCRQGYIQTSAPCSMRVRLLGNRGFITLKTKREGIAREEFEYSIPFEEAEYMLDHFCQQAQISQTRHYVTRGDLTWEVDGFERANQGLILAEVELKEPNQKIHLPEWVLEEVSGDRRYFNALLALHPFREWSHTDPA